MERADDPSSSSSWWRRHMAPKSGSGSISDASDNKLQSAAVPLSAIFSTLECLFFVLLLIVTFRLKPGRKDYVPLSVGLSLLCFCMLVSFAGSIYAFDEQEYPQATFALSQFLADLAALWLGTKSAKNDYIRGSASTWRGVLSCANSIVSIVFITGDTNCRIFGIIALVLRVLWLLEPIVMLKLSSLSSSSLASNRRQRTRNHLDVLDEWGLLVNRPSTIEGARVYISFPDEDDIDRDLEANNRIEVDGLSESLLAMDPSFVSGDSAERDSMEPILRNGGMVIGAGAPRNNSSSTTDSADSAPLVRQSNMGIARVVWGSASMFRPADDAGGPVAAVAPSQPLSLPETVRVISFKEVLTTGGVPLTVYVLLTDRNELSVHRYGEFRALCNRVVNKFFHECGVEAPPFPGRRVFRKLLPQSMGGVVQGAAADREFITSRANGLGEWTQKVLDFVRGHPSSDAAALALADFLKPIVRYTPNTDLEQVVNSAVLIFSNTVLNPIAPPSPCL